MPLGGPFDAIEVTAPAAGFIEGIPGIGDLDSVTIRVELPSGVIDPLEADTDGDGYRLYDGLVPDSYGWLTDGHEIIDLESNPFDIDSDHDSDLLPGPPFGADRVIDDRLAWDTTPDGTPIGTFVQVPDGIPDFPDALDPNPVSSDSDEDGLLDFIELLICPFVACETDDDRDDDGLSDGYEDRNLNGLSHDDRLDMNSPDTDGDGIRDGVELGLGIPRARNTARPFVGDTDEFRTNPASDESDGDGLRDPAEDFDLDGATTRRTAPGR